jgi:methionyl-tRNA formyltransferase
MPTSGRKIKIVFFGNERIATAANTDCPTLTKLIAENYDIAAVVVNHEPTLSRNRRQLEIAKVAAEHNVPLLAPRAPADVLEQLTAYQPDIGVLVAYGKIVPQRLIDVFPHGIINIHPSLLPLHRGPTPIESAILHGDSKTGVSIMHVSKQMDAGSVYAYSASPLTGNETKQGLADTLLELGSQMLLTVLPGIVSGDIVGQPQDDSQATYDRMITKQDGLLDLSKSAQQLEREIRAYLGWPGSRCIIAGKDVVVLAAHIAGNNIQNVDQKTIFTANKELCFQTGDGILVIDILKPAGKSAMPAAAFLAGHKHLL